MKEPITYWRATVVKDIAAGLIGEFHEHLEEATILYIFRSKHTESHGRVAFRTELESITGERPPAPVAESFYLMEVAWDTWTALTGPQRIALVDHELEHIGPTGLQGHDVEEFGVILARHGAWKPDLKAFLAAGDQQPLFEGAPPRRKSGAEIHEDVH
jgi:Putative phage metallopeptidase